MEMLFVFALVGLALVGGFIGLFLYLGHRNGRGDLVAPPKELGKREYGQRPAIRPAPKPVVAAKDRTPDPVPLAETQTAEELVAAISEPVPVSTPQSSPKPKATPEPTLAPEPAYGEIAPVWRREAPAGNAQLSEACYTAEQYAEREVKALLLQNHPNRAFTHARRALKLSDEAAMDFVERVARALRV